MKHYGLQGSFAAQKGKGRELAGIMCDASKLMDNADGCRLYMVALDKENEDRVLITEVWDSKQDHDDSLNYPGVRELIAKAMPLMDCRPQKGTEMHVIGGVDCSEGMRE
ncbi:MAG: antibiotic biosynthesis monooxygenase [Cyclobacteriaceae bacterium]